MKMMMKLFKSGIMRSAQLEPYISYIYLPCNLLLAFMHFYPFVSTIFLFVMVC